MPVMANFGRGVFSLLVIAVSGCGTPAGKKAARAPNWESDEFASMQARAPKPPAAVVMAAAAEAHTVAANQTETSWLSLDRWCVANNQQRPLRLSMTPPAYSLASSNGLFVFR